ncbi:DNA glycosylase [Laetiporus sulphureus 93-53]|uniref:Adenine DNA glycosylase n=1 Tax=Laetiporus sulphureus 93-53 TaxID=1314785 RepID=A0A165GF52_9APHY|nr:DNA glycosylase [Laetiporus sulphureus 93-53]KZT10266.1 DNA glycosylase [Laetiporus sulphureus 93-53]
MPKRRVAQSDDDYSDSSDAYDPAASSRKSKANPKRARTGTVSKRIASKKRTQDASDVRGTSDDGDSASRLAETRPHPLSVHTIADSEPIREALLDWYSGVHETRGMPWRKPFDPAFNDEQRAQRAYEVWVSEVMLQQTQVATVIPYYNRWMAKFPTIRDLAASDIETVNSVWKGLGYYSRAARLLTGARKAVEEFGGRLPDNAKNMEAKVPGIGRYSAGAICSIAYNQCVPVLDGNVHRLLSRLLALHAPPKNKQTLDVLWRGATVMVEDSTCPGDLNQALIELGSTVCKARDPSCSSCPVQPWCLAFKYQHNSEGQSEGATLKDAGELVDIEELCVLCETLPAVGLVTDFPMKIEKKKAREELDIVNVIEWRRCADGDRWFLLVRRPEGGLLSGLHEFPTAPNVPVTISYPAQIQIANAVLSDLLACPPQDGQDGSHAGTSEDCTLGESAGTECSSSRTLRIVKTEPAGDVIHVFSHIKKTYRVQWVVLEGGGDEPPFLTPLAPSFGTTARAKGRADGTQKAFRTVKANKTQENGRSVAGQATWMPLRNVAGANIGTGVLKVWKRVCTLWDDNARDQA